ncbi:class I SAM-dependent methyltransferase [Radicibacter daui]|uniref:class I SAM-dependent methyltransferase n=1 Tax=Radicibacter daui TaxID=3064829 RepID=UPI00404690DC
MLETRPSVTALSVAVLRAAHQRIDVPVVFPDPLAEAILGTVGAEALGRQLADPGERRRLRGSVVVRAAIAEAAVRAALARGVRQIVTLGAGLDTLACRLAPDFPDVRFFEVDHPATQDWKRQQLAAVGITPPASLKFLALDFETRVLGEALAEAGLETGKAACFTLLGIVPYVARDALMQTFAFVASLPAGAGEIVFDYGEPHENAAEPVRRAYRAMAEAAAAKGEPWVTAFEPADLHAALTGLGFRQIEDRGSGALAAEYFAGRQDGLSPGPLFHVVHARN